MSILWTPLGGPQEVSINNESGLYSLILTSRKPEAKKFKKWVTSEVLPTIRKTGCYMFPGAGRRRETSPIPWNPEKKGICPKCKAEKVPVSSSPPWDNGTKVRHHKCACGHAFATVQYAGKSHPVMESEKYDAALRRVKYIMATGEFMGADLDQTRRYAAEEGGRLSGVDLSPLLPVVAPKAPVVILEPKPEEDHPTAAPATEELEDTGEIGREFLLALSKLSERARCTFLVVRGERVLIRLKQAVKYLFYSGHPFKRVDVEASLLMHPALIGAEAKYHANFGSPKTTRHSVWVLNAEHSSLFGLFLDVDTSASSDEEDPS